MKSKNLQIEFNEEQRAAQEELNSAFIGERAVTDTLLFLEERLGKVHAVTIDYRNGICNFYKQNFRQAQQKMHDTGAVDILINRLTAKNETS